MLNSVSLGCLEPSPLAIVAAPQGAPPSTRSMTERPALAYPLGSEQSERQYEGRSTAESGRRGTHRGTKEIPWWTKKGTVVKAVVSCPPCCPAVELRSRASSLVSFQFEEGHFIPMPAVEKEDTRQRRGKAGLT